MLDLVLAICCSAAISLIMRLSEKKRRSSAGMFIFNYAICTVLGALYMPGISWADNSDSVGLTLGLGAIAGVLFLLSFVLLQINIRKNGVVMGAVFMKLGVIVPVLISVIIFRESPGIVRVIGIVIAIAAIVVFHFDKKEMSAAGSISLLLILMAASGLSDSMINIYDNVGNAALNDVFLLVTFFFALICSIILYIINKEKMGIWDLAFGILIGIPNYYSSRFLLGALQSVPAVVAYPVYSVITILIIGIVGIICFKERLTVYRTVGLVMVLAAVALLH